MSPRKRSSASPPSPSASNNVALVKRALAISLAAAMLFAAAGCGDKEVTDTGPNGEVTTTTVPNVHFAKTKFVLHAGLAFGAFHRYIYKPFQAGIFKAGADGRKKALVKAALAALFAKHELGEAHDSALSSDILRRKVIGPINNLLATVTKLAGSLKGGSFNPQDIVSAAGTIGAITSLSGDAGIDVKDRFAPIPGA